MFHSTRTREQELQPKYERPKTSGGERRHRSMAHGSPIRQHAWLYSSSLGSGYYVYVVAKKTRASCRSPAYGTYALVHACNRCCCGGGGARRGGSVPCACGALILLLRRAARAPWAWRTRRRPTGGGCPCRHSAAAVAAAGGGAAAAAAGAGAPCCVRTARAPPRASSAGASPCPPRSAAPCTPRCRTACHPCTGKPISLIRSVHVRVYLLSI